MPRGTLRLGQRGVGQVRGSESGRDVPEAEDLGLSRLFNVNERRRCSGFGNGFGGLDVIDDFRIEGRASARCASRPGCSMT